MIAEQLKQKFDIKNLLITKAKFYVSKNQLQVFATTDKMLSENECCEMAKYIEQLSGISTTIVITKNTLDTDAIKRAVFDFITNNIKSLSYFVHFDDISVTIDLQAKVYIRASKTAFDILDNNGSEKIEKHIKENFFCSCKVIAQKKETTLGPDPITLMEEQLNRQNTDNKNTDYFLLEQPNTYIGELTRDRAVPIKQARETDSITLCGFINYLTQKSYKRNHKKGVVEKPYATFLLNDGTGKISCSFFGSKKNVDVIMTLADGAKIGAIGSIQNFNDRLSFSPKNIFLIQDFSLKKPEKIYNEVASFYVCITPKKIEEYVQTSVLDENTNKFVDDTTYVVFDLETTGLNGATDEIVEIGAVKIENGIMTQSFCTLVKPKNPIPPEATKVNGITDELVADAPSIEDVLGDFYKFCHNSVLVAYNAEFDMNFLYNYGKKHNYKFDNKVLDVYALVKSKKLPTKNNKLGSVIAHYGIKNNSAHRALGDAIATAKLFSKVK